MWRLPELCLSIYRRPSGARIELVQAHSRSVQLLLCYLPDPHSIIPMVLFQFQDSDIYNSLAYTLCCQSKEPRWQTEPHLYRKCFVRRLHSNTSYMLFHPASNAIRTEYFSLASIDLQEETLDFELASFPSGEHACTIEEEASSCLVSSENKEEELGSNWDKTTLLIISRPVWVVSFTNLMQPRFHRMRGT